MRGLLLLPALLLAAACDARSHPGDGIAVRADAARRFPLVGAFRLNESSAAAVSARHPGVFYTINDSGNDPVLYAFDTTGMAMGRWVVRKAGSHDWEALAVAPCALSGGDSTRSCVYIGDVGDNGLERRTITIYRVPEPDTLTPRAAGEVFPDSLHARYPDGAHNVEAMVVAPDGAILLFTKESAHASLLGPRPTGAYRIAPRTWVTGDTAVAELVDSIAIGLRFAPRRTVTDAALDRDARLLVLRTYENVLLYAADSVSGLPLRGTAPVVCDVTTLGEPQGEGIGIVQVGAQAVRLVLTSEGQDTPSHTITCPLPPVPSPQP